MECPWDEISLESSPQKCHLPYQNKKYWAFLANHFPNSPIIFLKPIDIFFSSSVFTNHYDSKSRMKNSKNSRSNNIKKKRSRHPSNKATVITFYDQFIWWSFSSSSHPLSIAFIFISCFSDVNCIRKLYESSMNKLHLNRRIILAIVLLYIDGGL